MSAALTANPGVSFRTPVLAWSLSADDEQRFRRISRTVLLAALFWCLVLPWLTVTAPDRSAPQALPARMATLLLEREVPPPKKPDPVKAPEQQAKQDSKTDAPKPSPKDMPLARAPEARQPMPNKSPGELLDNVRRKAAGVGLLAMKDSLAELRGAPMAVQLNADIKQGPGVGSGVGVGVGAGNEAGLPVRSLITSNATGGSGGLNTAAYSRNTGGGGLAGRATTLVEGVAGGGGGGGAGGGGSSGAHGRGGSGNGLASAGGAVQRGASGKASRSIEEIKLVFERNKGAIYAIYNRALREEPSLQGKVVLKLTIAPSGGVVDCRIVSSELNAPELESKLLARIRQFDFVARDVDQMVVTWPVDFLPS